MEGAEGVETSVSATYRVWCLSWEDAEEDGRDVAWYSILDGPPPHSAERTVFSWHVTDAESAVEAYADYVHSHRDGWDCTWPLRFRVRKPDGTIEDFEVEREYDPTFSATRIKEPDHA